MLRHLRRNGLRTSTFWYCTALENFEGIKNRLLARIVSLAKQGEYIVIGHSLGGVLLRDSLAALPNDAKQPRHLFLLASPVYPSRLAIKFQNNFLYRILTGDCGQLLGSTTRMAAIAPVKLPTTAIIGSRGFPWQSDLFANEINDGVVSLSEVTANWLQERKHVHTVHTLLPANRQVAEIIAGKIVTLSCCRLRDSCPVGENQKR